MFDICMGMYELYEFLLNEHKIYDFDIDHFWKNNVVNW